MSKFQCSCAIASLSVISMMSAHATSFSLVWLKTANMAVANEQQWALEAVNKLLLLARGGRKQIERLLVPFFAI